MKNHEEHVRRDISKQYRCDVCDRSYANQNSLHTHIQKVSEVFMLCTNGCPDRLLFTGQSQVLSSLNPFPNDKFFTLPNSKHRQTTILNLTKMAESSLTGRKHCGKRINCSLRAISPFPTVFSRGTADTEKPGLVWERVK